LIYTYNILFLICLGFRLNIKKDLINILLHLTIVIQTFKFKNYIIPICREVGKNMTKNVFRNGIVIGIIFLFAGAGVLQTINSNNTDQNIEENGKSVIYNKPISQNVISIIPSMEKIDITTSKTIINNGSLLGYVNDTSMNGIEGALVRVHFHDTYEENYTDSTGYYHVTNIPICYCLKNATCSKEGFKTEWVLLGIAENTTHDFILMATNQPPDVPIITGPQSGIVRVEYEYNFSLFDSDGDSMYLRVDWGICSPGKWYGPYASGSIVTLNYSWNKKGAYIIRAQAQDSSGFESDWGTLEVTMPRNKISANLMFQRFQEKFEGFFERFSNTCPILHRLLLIGLTRYV